MEVGIKTNGSEQTVSAFKNMSTSAKNLSNDIKGVTKETELLATTTKMAEKYFQLKDAKANVKSLKKEIESLRKTNAEAAKDKQTQLAQEEANVKRLNEEYKALGKVASNQAKEMANVPEPNGGSGDSLWGGLGSGLVRLRMMSQLGQALQQNVFATGTSMYGNIKGSALSNIAGGALSGFTMGAYTGNPLIMGVGAGVGALTGVVQTATEKMERTDDAFRAEVENLYNQVQSEREAGLQAGIEYAATEESNLRAMGILLGSQEKGEKMYQELKNYGINTMYQTQNMLTSAKRMLAYGVSEDQIMQAVEWIGDIAMGEQSKFDSLAYVYGQTASAGKLTGQDLRQYTEAGFNPLAWLAEERGVSLEAMREEMSAGKVLYQDVMHAFELATAEGAKFGGSAEAMMNTYAGKMSKLADIQADVEGGYGRGYNQKREEGLDYEIGQYEGELGKEMEHANYLIGQYEADLENQHQEYIINAMNSVMSSEEFERANLAGNYAEAGRLVAEAKAQAEIDWNNSEGMQQKVAQEIALVESIGQDAAVNDAYIQLGIQRADAFSVGYYGRLNEAMSGGKMDQQEYIQKSLASGNPLQIIKMMGTILPINQKASNEYYANKQSGSINSITVPKNETINETTNTSQTFNVSTSVVVNEAAAPETTYMAVLGNITKASRTAARNVKGTDGKYKTRWGH